MAKKKSQNGKAAGKKSPSRRVSAPAPRAGWAKSPGKRRSAGRTRPAWSGNLRLALVSVPVQIHPATKSGAQIAFHQVHRPSGKRIRYQKTVPGLGPVDTDEIVKGFEVENGKYVLFEPDELEVVKIEARRTLDLVQFVTQSEIDPIWFDRPYYVVPDGELAEEAYGVLRDAMRASGRTGLGQFVMRGREYVAAIRPCGSGLLLETLRFADEVRRAAPYFTDIEDVRPDKELLSLAEELIERKTGPFDPKRFEDHYTAALRELIDAKTQNRKTVEVDEDEPTGGGKVIDLVEALKRSVRSDRSERGSPRSGAATRKAG